MRQILPRRDIDIQIRTQGVKHILFDLGGLTFIDSSGLGVILGRYRKVSENGGRAAISGAPPNIQKVMEISGLTRLMPFFVDCASALRELAYREVEPLMMRNRMRLEFLSCSENVGLARVAVATFASGVDFNLSDLEEIKVAVSEAVSNAIIHGYEERFDRNGAAFGLTFR